MVQGVGKENGFLPWKSLNLMNTRASMKGIKKRVRDISSIQIIVVRVIEVLLCYKNIFY